MNVERKRGAVISSGALSPSVQHGSRDEVPVMEAHTQIS